MKTNTGDKPSVQVRKEGRRHLHQQTQNATLRPLLRTALPRRGDIECAEEGIQGERRERRGLEASMLQAFGGRSSKTGMGH